jgi:DNA-binding GntR family transcriptional regulator
MGMPAETLTDQAYGRIQREILDGRLALGSRLSELSLAERLGIGRMPVREAIRRLQAEGVLQQVPRYGTIVRKPERRDIVEVYELREALEVYAVGKAVARISADQIERLAALCDRMRAIARTLGESKESVLCGEELQEHLAADKAFHTLLIHAGGNRRIAAAVMRTRVLAQIFSTYVLTFDVKFLRQVYDFHRRMLQAVKQGNSAEAQRITGEHIRAGLHQMLEHFDQLAQEPLPVDDTELPPDVAETLAALPNK